MMFKNYKDISDVVSLIAYCSSDKSFLLNKEVNGEYWLPSSKTDGSNCWKVTAQKIKFELFGVDAPSCTPVRVYRVWLPNTKQQCVYHALYKISVKSDVKKRTKAKAAHTKLQWINSVELERLRVHFTLRSPEVAVFAQLALGEKPDNLDNPDIQDGFLSEICEENFLLLENAAGAAGLATPHLQLLQAAKYTRDDQIRIFREFMVLVFPALYISPLLFAQFMVDLGWPRTQCPHLFRSADVTGRGGLSFLDLMIFMAALEPGTQHGGTAAEIRCRYIFRYFDSNSDSKLEYMEFKELVAATRQKRQLQIDALSVSRDADNCIRQLGLPANSPLSLSEFLRAVGELGLRGTSSLLRAPRSISGYLADLVDREFISSQQSSSKSNQIAPLTLSTRVSPVSGKASARVSGREVRAVELRPDYAIAANTVLVRKKFPMELVELKQFDEESVSPSSWKLVSKDSTEVLAASSGPVEAFAAVHYFASTFDKSPQRRRGSTATGGKAPWSWLAHSEEAALGSLLLRLAETVRPLCAAEPRLLKLAAPVYVIGDLHGNLAALLAIETALWPQGTAMVPARLLFLGDYVDRGPHGTELMAYLFAAKIQRPHGVLLVRGNHETRDIQKMFSFYGECIQKYGEEEGERIWNAINSVFDVLPLAAVVDDKVFCCHGGIPPPWVCPLVSAIDKVPTPLPRPAEQSSIAWELLWNDPVKQNKMTTTLSMELAANEGFAANARRGTGHVFDQNALERFLNVNQMSHVVRAHELYQNGFMCQLRGRLISVFSSSHYCGGTNDSGVALLEEGKLRLIRVVEE